MSHTLGTPETAHAEFNTWSGGLGHPRGIPATDPASSVWGHVRRTRRSMAGCEAELIQARGRISQLELQLELSKTRQAAKRARTEEDSEEGGERERQTSATSRELQRLHTLDEERQSLAEQLAEAQEQLRERERGDREEMARLQSLVADLEKKERENSSSMEELRSELSSLRNENSLLSSQLNLAKKESAVVRACLEDQLQTQTSADKALRERVAELEGVRDKLEAEQERVKQLQHRLKQAKHDIQFAQSLQSKLLHGEDQERELKQLREENTVLRNHVDNVGLMQYQLQTLREQVERNEDMERRAVRLEEENKLLKEQLTSNEDDESSTGSSGLHNKLTRLQHKEVVLTSQIGDLESKLKLAQMSAERAESSTKETQIQLTREQEECKLRGEKVQRLEKRLLFVTKLRDGCVNVLNSYRLESGVDELLKQNLAEVERQLASANERIAELEGEVEQLSSDK